MLCHPVRTAKNSWPHWGYLTDICHYEQTLTVTFSFKWQGFKKQTTAGSQNVSQNSKHLTKVTLHLCVSPLRFSDFLKTHFPVQKNLQKASCLTHITPQGIVSALVFALSHPHLEKIKTNENQHFISDVIAGNEALLWCFSSPPLPPLPPLSSHTSPASPETLP